MTQQQSGRPAQTNQTPLLTHGSAERLTFDHRWDFPHLDTQYSNHQEEEILQAEGADSQEEEEEDSQEEILGEEEADSQAEEDLCKVTLKEDHQGTDS